MLMIANYHARAVELQCVSPEKDKTDDSDWEVYKVKHGINPMDVLLGIFHCFHN